MAQWLVARRRPDERWAVSPRTFTAEEAIAYARRLPEGVKVVGLDLDSLPELPTLGELVVTETQDEIADRARAAVADVPTPPGDPTWGAIRELSEHELEAAGLTPDMVNHPPHYGGLPCGVEVIEITEHLNFNRGNAVKYLLRAGKKGDPAKEIEDLRKAAWYASREADRLESGSGR